MRSKDDDTYQEYKESAFWSFVHWRNNEWPPEMTANWVIDEGMGNIYGYLMTDISEFLFFLSFGEYEVRNNILEDRILDGLSYHIYRYENMGKYKSDLTEEEITEVEKDIAYIKSKVELPEMKTYADKDWSRVSVRRVFSPKRKNTTKKSFLGRITQMFK